MTHSEKIYDIVLGGLALAGCWYLLAFQFRRLILAQFRLELFMLRDRLFFAACEHELPFEHTTYRTLRHAINGMIAHAEILGLGSLLVARRLGLSAAIWHSDPVDRPLEDIALRLEGPAKPVVDRIQHEFEQITFRHMLLGSPATIGVAIVLSVGSIAAVGYGTVLAVSAGSRPGTLFMFGLIAGTLFALAAGRRNHVWTEFRRRLLASTERAAMGLPSPWVRSDDQSSHTMNGHSNSGGFPVFN